MSTALVDNHGRTLHYLRLAVTDRCNLRCQYCMPEEGLRYLPKKELLSFEEIERFVTLIAQFGITKIRLTGGEPFMRRDLMKLIRKIMAIPGIHDLHITTNGVFTAPYIPELKALGIASVNLSLDTLDHQRFFHITRRNEFEKVMDTFHQLLYHKIPVKINAVVMDQKNTEDILPLIELTRHHPVSVRFIEEMPFNGDGNHYSSLHWNYKRILQYIQLHYPDIYKIPDPEHSTSYHYAIPGHSGNIGIIAAFSRTFCGSCNRIRLTSQGMLKTCLYDDGVLNIKELLRSTPDDAIVKEKLIRALLSRAENGFEAENKRRNQQPVQESMSTIGG